MLLLDVSDADKVEMLFKIFGGVPEANTMFVQEYANVEQGEEISCSVIRTKLQGLVYAYTQGVGSQPQDGGKGGKQADPNPGPSGGGAKKAPERRPQINEEEVDQDEKKRKDEEKKLKEQKKNRQAEIAAAAQFSKGGKGKDGKGKWKGGPKGGGGQPSYPPDIPLTAELQALQQSLERMS